MIGECLLAPQTRRSSFSDPGWTLGSLSTGPSCVTTYHFCSLAAPPSPTCLALLPGPVWGSSSVCLRFARTSGHREPELRAQREREREESERGELESSEGWRCLCALNRSAGTFYSSDAQRVSHNLLSISPGWTRCCNQQETSHYNHTVSTLLSISAGCLSGTNGGSPPPVAEGPVRISATICSSSIHPLVRS